jgi:Tol biopolymer transport system component
MSGDGRFVAFISCASNLVAGDTNGYHDVFVHDRLTGMTERVSVSSAGEQGDADAHAASISAGGRFVAFDSWANNLVSQPTAVWVDAFLRDRLAGTTELVSVSSSGEAGNCESSYPSVSADGRFVAFLSLASNLVPGEQYTEPLPGHPFGFSDIFVRDRLLAGS